MPPDENDLPRPHSSADSPIQQIGPYKILEPLGEGGTGMVFVADQLEPVKRKVALKLIKPGMDSKQVLARFEAERQALAVMDHPNIAKVFDGGVTEAGRPYFVMELVRGDPITTYCDTNRLPIRKRLEVFAEVCLAVQHAHQKGVIHRDLKPSNILVTLQNEKPVPKVIDFGIAKAMGQRLTDATLQTQRGAIIGTPAYMSPEQAGVTGLDADTRADIYSLGVVLYELLTGELPFAPKDLQGMAVVVTLRDTEPPTPSTRFRGLGERQRTIAERRRTDPGALGRKLRGDLDRIAMKAMAKDRTQRYETANGLALDVRRYLNDEPVAARAPSAGYRVRKFVSRHRVGVAFGAVTLALLLAFGITMSVQAARIAEQRDRANLEAETAKQVSDFMVDLFSVSDPSEARGNTITAREILDKGAQEIEEGLEDQPVVQGRLLEVMGRVYHGLGLYTQAEALLEQAVAVRRAAPGDADAELASSLRELAHVQLMAGKPNVALPLAQEALAIDETVLGLNDPYTAKSHLLLGRAYRELGEYDKAREHLEQALAINERVLGPDHMETARVLQHVGWLHVQLGQADTARVHLERAIPIAERQLGSDNPEFAHFLSDLGVVYDKMGDDSAARVNYQRALEIREKALGPDHMLVAWALNNLGNVESNAGNLEEARRYYERAIEIVEGALGPESPTVAGYLNNLGLLLQRSGKYAEALTQYERALAIREKSLGPEHQDVASTLGNLGYLRRYAGDAAGARPLLERAVAIIEKATGNPHHPRLINPVVNLGFLFFDLGDYERSRTHRERVLAIVEQVYGEDHRTVAFPLSQLAEVLVKLEDFDTALSLLQKAERIQPDAANLFYALAILNHAQGKTAKADSLFRRWLDAVAEDQGRESAWFAFHEARYYAIYGKRDEALKLLELAMARGYSDPWLTRIGDLHFLRGDPRFEAIVAEVKKRAGIVDLVP